MSISILYPLITVMVLAPLWSHQIFRESFERQKMKIAIDNAAILIGRGDRQIFNFVENSNKAIKALEAIHHPIHLAVRSGMASPQLASQDLVLELSLKELHLTTRKLAETKWISSTMLVGSELGRLGGYLKGIQRSKTCPLNGRRCPICNLELYWKVDALRTNSFLNVQMGEQTSFLWTKIIRKLSSRGAEWNYYLSLN